MVDGSPGVLPDLRSIKASVVLSDMKLVFFDDPVRSIVSKGLNGPARSEVDGGPWRF